jgi:hypothetical protein
LRTIVAPRASAILYDLVHGRDAARPFLLPANICPIVPLTFLKAGVSIEFVDISANSLLMDLDQAETRLRLGQGKYGGLLYAHTYGDLHTPHDRFARLKERWPELLIIDDRCLCPPDFEPDDAQPSDVTLYSTGHAKIADVGFGGYAFVSDQLGVQHVALPFHQKDLVAIEADYDACVSAGKPFVYRDSAWLHTDAKLPAWQDYAGRLRKATAESVAHRQSINAVYNLLIPPELRLPDRFQLWRYSVRLADKTSALKEIFAAGLFASSHYASLVGIMGSGSGEHARALADHVVNLFNDSHYTPAMAESTARIILGNA